MNITIKTKIKFLYTNLLCSFLFVKNLFFAKKLNVEHFIYSTKLTVRGNETELNWNVVGCHRITISNVAILPGNLSHQKVKLENKINDLEITFNGIGGQKQTKKITIESTSPSVLTTFSSKTNLSNLSSVPLIREDLKKTLNDSYAYQIPKKIKLNQPKILSQKLRVDFEPFIKSNYPINQ